MNKNSAFGFTLIEILLVTIILSIIASLTVVNFSPSFKKYKLKDSVDQLMYLMQYAQSQSVVNAIEIKMEFNPDLSSYTFKSIPSDSDLTEKDFISMKGRLGKDYKLPKEVKVESESQSIMFYPDGQIEKKEIKVCVSDKCQVISSKLQRGRIHLLNDI